MLELERDAGQAGKKRAASFPAAEGEAARRPDRGFVFSLAPSMSFLEALQFGLDAASVE